MLFLAPHLPDPHRARWAEAAPGQVHPGQVLVVAAPVAGVAVVADPSERHPRVVLPRLRPLREPGHLAPAAARAGDDVRRQAEWVLAPWLVPMALVAGRDVDLVAPDQVEDVGQQAAVDARASLARDRHEPAAAGARAQAAPVAGGPVVHPLAAEVERVEHLGANAIAAAAAAPDGVDLAVAHNDRVVPVATVGHVRAPVPIQRVVAGAPAQLVVARAAVDPGRQLRGDGRAVLAVAQLHLGARDQSEAVHRSGGAAAHAAGAGHERGP